MAPLTADQWSLVVAHLRLAKDTADHASRVWPWADDLIWDECLRVLMRAARKYRPGAMSFGGYAVRRLCFAAASARRSKLFREREFERRLKGGTDRYMRRVLLVGRAERAGAGKRGAID